jgi:hypothetical protein
VELPAWNVSVNTIATGVNCKGSPDHSARNCILHTTLTTTILPSCADANSIVSYVVAVEVSHGRKTPRLSVHIRRRADTVLVERNLDHERFGCANENNALVDVGILELLLVEVVATCSPPVINSIM